MRHAVIGTAGHVDHGKTWLTRALTGTDTDRLKEERERGITIDIGFAALELPDGSVAGVVDVPGHERLIKNMLAGATGIDLVLLVVAADEGFMPQTQEHLDILGLLGVRRGIVVLTKCDLVDGEWLEVAREDVADHVRGTFLEGAPVACVSAVTGEGVGALKELIAREVSAGGDERSQLACRLPVDRVFTVRGHGTVVTGSLVDGRVRTGDVLEAYPLGRRVRVRELQNHGQTVGEAGPGIRLAVNVVGAERSELERGCTLAAPGSLTLSRCVTARLELLEDAPFAVKNASTVHFYLGTQELVGRVRLLDSSELAPGGSGFAQFTFETELAVRDRDRFIIRFFSPVATLGGGTVLDAGARRLRRDNDGVLARLRRLDAGLAVRACQVVEDGRLSLAPDAVVASRCGVGEAELARAVAPLCASGGLRRVSGRLVSAHAVSRLASEVEGLLAAYHESRPLEAGMRMAELRERVMALAGGPASPRDADALIAEALPLAHAAVSGGIARLEGFSPALTPGQRELLARIEGIYGRAGLEAPLTEDVRAELGDPRDFGALHGSLVSSGELVPLTSSSCVSRGALERALATFCEMFEEGGPVTLGDFRTRAGVSRKYAQLTLDRLDKMGFTRRVGDARVPAAGPGAARRSG